MADKVNVGSFAGSYASVEALNESLYKIDETFNDKVLWRDNPSGTDNSMSNDLDMGSNDILNVGEDGGKVATEDYVSKQINDLQADPKASTVLQASRKYGDGVTVSFSSPLTTFSKPLNFIVNLDGVTQRSYIDYNVSNDGKVVFTEPPAQGMVVDISYFNAELIEIEGIGGIVPRVMPRLIGDGTTLSFPTTATSAFPENSYEIYLDGIKQRADIDYLSDDSGNIVFSVAPPDETIIDITLFEPVNISVSVDAAAASATAAAASASLAEEIVASSFSLEYVTVAASQAIEPNIRYGLDSSVAGIILTLPASLDVGDTFYFSDAEGQLETNPVTIARNGHLILGLDEDFQQDVSYNALDLVYSGATQGVILA